MQVSIAGFDMPDPDSGGGEVRIVDCTTDEAVGMALASGSPLYVERDIFEAAALVATPKLARGSENRLRLMLKVQLPGFAGEDGEEAEDGRRAAAQGAPPAWKIRSRSDLQRMTVKDKARTLLASSNFKGRLPRPRVVRDEGPEVSPGAVAT